MAALSCVRHRSSILGDWTDHVLDYISLASCVFLMGEIISLGCDGLGVVLAVLGLLTHEGAVFTTWWSCRFTGKVRPVRPRTLRAALPRFCWCGRCAAGLPAACRLRAGRGLLVTCWSSAVYRFQ